MAQIVRRVITSQNAPKPVGPYSFSFLQMSTLIRRIIFSKSAPMVAGSPYNQAVQVGETVYVSGVLGLDKDTMKLVPGGATSEATRALDNLGAILKAANSSYANVVKTTIFLDDINDFASVNEQYKAYFKDPYPARSTFQVGKLPLGAKVEIEAIAISGTLVDK